MVPYSPLLPLEALDTGIFLLAVFTPELETDYPSETSLCTVAILLYFVHANEIIKANYHKYNQQLFHECELDMR